MPLTYAGRLDPMAEGLLMVLAGEDRLLKEKYLALPKEYEMEILFGFETDTYDLLGIVRDSGIIENQHNINYTKIFEKFIGDIEQEYPPYSSKPVEGKPLFQIAREGKINEVKIPTHIVNIESIKIIEKRKITKENLQKYINEKIPLVVGDFRQNEILESWSEALSNTPQSEFQILKINIACGSGAYMRSLAHDIGKIIGVSTVCFSLKRTKIGKFKI